MEASSFNVLLVLTVLRSLFQIRRLEKQLHSAKDEKPCLDQFSLPRKDGDKWKESDCRECECKVSYPLWETICETLSKNGSSLTGKCFNIRCLSIIYPQATVTVKVTEGIKSLPFRMAI